MVGPEVVNSTFLPLILRMAKDPVPNIRFNVARTLHALIPTLDSNVVQNQVKPALSKLFDDSDKDVKFFASQAMQSC